MKFLRWLRSIWRPRPDMHRSPLGGFCPPQPWPEEMFDAAAPMGGIEPVAPQPEHPVCYGCGGPTVKRKSLILGDPLDWCPLCRAFSID